MNCLKNCFNRIRVKIGYIVLKLAQSFGRHKLKLAKLYGFKVVHSNYLSDRQLLTCIDFLLRQFVGGEGIRQRFSKISIMVALQFESAKDFYQMDAACYINMTKNGYEYKSLKPSSHYGCLLKAISLRP